MEKIAEEKLDVLNRSEFVDKLMNLMENISDNRSSTCFAINGTWGCGKSFVLDMFQERLERLQSEETNTDKYFVVRYNCWEFDYYEEPLLAIVSAIMATIEEKTKLFPDGEGKGKALGALKAVGVSLLSMGASAAKAATGLDFEKSYDVLRENIREGASDYKDDHSYDVYFGFHRVLKKFSEQLQEIAKDHTIVFLVDELDRCLPKYAMKVLERLHHLTEGQSSIVTILTIDKDQLVSSVHQIFGFQNPEKYLEKFIQFEIKLDCGTVSEKIMEKFSTYVTLFNADIFPVAQPIEECLQAILKDVEVRKQEQIMKRAEIAHRLLFSEPKDYTFMCMEVLITVMICVYQDNACCDERTVDIKDFQKVFVPARRGPVPAFSEFFKEKFEEIELRPAIGMYNTTEAYVVPDEPSLYSAILLLWCMIHSKKDSSPIKYYQGTKYGKIAVNKADLKKFAETIKMML